MEKWQNPKLSLGERCVAFAENEMKNGVKEDKPGSFTSPRIREYFSICTRIVNGKETPIGKTFTTGNWCAAAVSYALHSSLLPGETAPHGYRLGVVEIVSDLSKKNLYTRVADVRKNPGLIKVGDPVVFDRSNPNNPSTAWWRHIGFVYSTDGKGNFQCISGNSTGGQYRITNHTLSQKTLLGFGQYPELIKSVMETETNDGTPSLEEASPKEGLINKPSGFWEIISNFIRSIFGGR